MDFEHFNSIKVFDKILVSLVHEEDIERYLQCPSCMVKGKDRYFSDVGPGFEPHDEMELCQSLSLIDEDFGDTFIEEKHGLDIKQKWLIGRKEQVSTLHEFLKDGIQTIEKVPFRELEGDLEVGHQIWIYRQKDEPLQPRGCHDAIRSRRRLRGSGTWRKEGCSCSKGFLFERGHDGHD